MTESDYEGNWFNDKKVTIQILAIHMNQYIKYFHIQAINYLLF